MKIALLVFIACGTLYLSNGINSLVKNKQDAQARDVIIKALASECRAIKESQGYPNTFHASARTLEKILGKGVNNFDQDTYLELISLCLVDSRGDSI